MKGFNNYLLKRLVQFIPVILGITLVSFVVMNLAPGDPTAMFFNPRINPEEILKLKENFGLNKPILTRYFFWLGQILKGNFGYSLVSGQPVSKLILERLPATLLLTGTAFGLTFFLAVILGIFSAIKKNSFFDKLVTFLTFLGFSMPSFWLGLILILIFSLKLKWLPSSGMYNFKLAGAGIFLSLWDRLRHLILPILVLVIGGMAGLVRYQRGAMLDVLSEEYLVMARAKGLPERLVILRHALRNALIPVITILGLSLPDFFAGAFITETIFAWPGMGRLGVEAVFARDYPLVMGIVLISAILVVLGNLLADIIYVLIDPRIRLGARNV